jgi:uncharacterized protein (DUF608 family)
MFLLTIISMFHAAPELTEFSAPGFSHPVSGVWYGPGEAASGLPLGALGTGFIDLSSNVTFGDATTENTWLHPKPSGPKSGFDLTIGDKVTALRAESGATLPTRFWGHFPVADVDFGNAFGDVEVYLRAFSPLIPHDYELSALPAALFRFTVKNADSKPAPVEIALQWQAAVSEGRTAGGNVEGALGWHRETLAPGETWVVAPIIAFASSKTELVKTLDAATLDGQSIEGEQVAEGKSYAFGEVEEFLLDDSAGFNWETHRRHSALVAGKRHIGQLLWQLCHGERRCGRGLSGPYGFVGKGLPSETEDHALRVRFRPVRAATNAIALVFAVENITNEPLADLEFDLAVNFDLGGPERAEKQTAEWNPESSAIVFADAGLPTLAALAGKADSYIVGVWPQAHQAMEARDLIPAAAPGPQQRTQAIDNGIQLDGPRGAYAVGAQAPEGWSVECTAPQGDTIRAVARKEMAPGETCDIVFALAWYFPTWVSSDGETLRHRYAARWGDAGQVLHAALEQSAEIQDKLTAWQETIYASDISPALKDALINGLYILARNTWWMDDGRFFQSESFTGCPITETFVCRFNGSFPLALLFPECERATMRSVARAQAASGEIPFGFGSPLGSRSPMYHVQHPIVSSEFVLTTWRNYALWKDDAYLAEMYPAIVSALRFAMTLDKDGDGLINEDPGSDKGWPAHQYYDIWPWWGTSAYTAGIWLAALRAGQACAERQGDAAFAEELKSWFTRGSAAFEEKLWTGQYYRLYNDPAGNRISETSLTNALCGQWFAYACGLGEIFPRKHIESVIDAVFRLNVAATPYGAVNGVGPDGKMDETYHDHSAVITIGEVWNFCAMTAFAGRIPEAVQLFDRSYENLAARQKTPWNITWSLDPATGALKWGWNYYSNTCVWTLLQAVAPTCYESLGKPRTE